MLVVILLLLVFPFSALANETATDLRVAGLILEPVMQELGEVEEGEHVLASLLVRNNTEETAKIIAVEASCGCTRAIPDQYILMPGEFTLLNVDIDTAGKTGRVKKNIIVTDQAGRQSTAWMMLTVNPSAHHQRRGHGIFDAACVRCHAQPARGKQDGRAIYQAVCAMCHGSDASGDYAPNLRHISSAAALTTMISQGLDPRHMPGFAKDRGGPLSDEQVAALVKWLLSLD